MTDLGFHHIYHPETPGFPTLLLLPGTGGDEHDLIDLGRALMPEAGILSVRGKVLENGMPRFFRRLAEGVFDLEDLKFRTDELADFIIAARQHYAIQDIPLIAVGYSNGANIAASILLQRPAVLDHALLLRAMVPFEPEQLPDLSGKKVLMLSGTADTIIPLDNSKRLAALLTEAKADISFIPKPAGHGLTQSDLSEGKEWLGKVK